MRIDLTTLPERMKSLKMDPERDIPVPWFVDWLDGKPEFRAMDRTKFIAAVRQKLCWVCGQKMGVYACFVAGPMCGINRTSSEPPSHLECGRWSAINCPFLNNPRMVRREDELMNNASMIADSPGMAITRNPGVTMLWITREYQMFKDAPLFMMGKPESIEWYAEGRGATRAEVEQSIEDGLPALEAAARSQEGGVIALERAIKRFEPLLPA